MLPLLRLRRGLLRFGQLVALGLAAEHLLIDFGREIIDVRDDIAGGFSVLIENHQRFLRPNVEETGVGADPLAEERQAAEHDIVGRQLAGEGQCALFVDRLGAAASA